MTQLNQEGRRPVDHRGLRPAPKSETSIVPGVEIKITPGQIQIANQIAAETAKRGLTATSTELAGELILHGVSNRVVQIRQDLSLNHRLHDPSVDYGTIAGVAEAADYLSSRKIIPPGISALKNKIIDALLFNDVKPEDIIIADHKSLRGKEYFQIALKGNEKLMIQSGIYHALGINIGHKGEAEHKWDFISIEDAAKKLSEEASRLNA